VNGPLHRSRTLASVAALAGDEVEHRFTRSRVLLTGEAEALLTPNGAEMMGTALQLLMRICSKVDVALPPLIGPLAARLELDGERFAWDERPRFVGADADLHDYDAILSVGGAARADLAWTAIAASGWMVRVTSGPESVDDDCGIENPIAALAAASLGVGEVFKRLIDLKPELGGLVNGLTFSLWDYRVDGADGPAIPKRIDKIVMVNGAGAIGSAIVHGLARLPVTSEVIIVDKQDYGDENWGTCLDLERTDVGDGKAETAALRLQHPKVVLPFKSTITEVFKHKLGSETPWPDVLLNGLDGVDARHEAQDVWPDLVIDGALDADLQVRVSAHLWDGDRACLRCLYRHAPGESAEASQMRATGLSLDSLRDQDRELTQEDIAKADPAHREALKAQLGKRICSIVSAAILSSREQAEEFSPSVPFAASLSACLVLTEFIRFVLTGSVAVAPLFQMSLAVGPEAGQLLADRRHEDCLCKNRHLIDRLREERANAA